MTVIHRVLNNPMTPWIAVAGASASFIGMMVGLLIFTPKNPGGPTPFSGRQYVPASTSLTMPEEVTEQPLIKVTPGERRKPRSKTPTPQPKHSSSPSRSALPPLHVSLLPVPTSSTSSVSPSR